MDDLISRQAAIDAVRSNYEGILDFRSDGRTIADSVEDIISELPSAQPEQDREFIKLTVEDSNGRPYYSIIYLELDDNGVGHDFEGYSSYSLDVVSDYLKKYFMPSAQPERKKGMWLPDNRPGGGFWVCSCCKFPSEAFAADVLYKFCPNCGADMRGEQDG